MKTALTKTKILRSLEEKRESLRKFGVIRIGLFGSYLKGNPSKKSDVDILVSFKKPTFDSYMDLKFLLEQTFGRKVDLVIEGSLKNAMLYVKKEAHYVKAA